MKEQRVEIWFKDGLFRAFPYVKPGTVDRRKDDTLCFQFGNEHEAIINMSNVNFIEIMDCIESAEAHN